MVLEWSEVSPADYDPGESFATADLPETHDPCFIYKYSRLALRRHKNGVLLCQFRSSEHSRRASPAGAPLMEASPKPAPRRTVESLDPATGRVWKRFDTTSKAAVLDAVSRAKTAQPGWAGEAVG